jgi:putative SOS response-associated peptidase YedK
MLPFLKLFAMCGRYSLSLPAATLAELLTLDLPEVEMEPRYNMAPSQRLPVVTDAEPNRLQWMRWGLIPSWAKDPSIGHKLINARSETLAEKPAFRYSFSKQRCLVPADGFYEWKPGPLGKTPYHIHLQDRSLMTFAGLWETWKDAEGREIMSFNIVTVEPNALMAPIHDRMPAIILPKDRKTWLDPATSQTELMGLLKPYSLGDLQADAVGNRVNSPLNEGPELWNPPFPSLF